VAGKDFDFSSLFEHAPIGLFIAGLDGKILHATPYLAEQLGYPSQKALISAGAAGVFADRADYTQLESLMTESKASGEDRPQDMRVKVRRQDGTIFGAVVRASLMPDASGDMHSYAAVVEPEPEREPAPAAGLPEDAKPRSEMLQHLEDAQMQIVLALARAADARDGDSAAHSERLATLAEAMGRRMGLPEEHIQHLRLASLLHDIGKIGLPPEIVRKAGPLTGADWLIMRLHPVLGEQIVLQLHRNPDVARIIRQHQERWDGSGYPDRLAGDRILVASRILAVVDSYIAMTSHRPYRAAKPHADAIGEIQLAAGTKYDPQVVKVFLDVFGTGSR